MSATTSREATACNSPGRKPGGAGRIKDPKPAKRATVESSSHPLTRMVLTSCAWLSFLIPSLML